MNQLNKMETKHTKVELFYTKNRGSIVIHDDEKNALCDIWYDKTNEEEAEANAKLIVEAGTITNKYGLTPSQLLEQRNELLEALIYLIKCNTIDRFRCEINDAIDKANNTINKATK